MRIRDAIYKVLLPIAAKTNDINDIVKEIVTKRDALFEKNIGTRDYVDKVLILTEGKINDVDNVVK